MEGKDGRVRTKGTLRQLLSSAGKAEARAGEAVDEAGRHRDSHVMLHHEFASNTYTETATARSIYDCG